MFQLFSVIQNQKKKMYSDYVSFDKIARKHKIKNIKVQNINDKKNIELLKKSNKDIDLLQNVYGKSGGIEKSNEITNNYTKGR